MAAILTNYDLSLGETRTSVITGASYADIQVLLGTVSGQVKFRAQKSQSTGDWIDMKDQNNNVIEFFTVDEKENGINIQGMGGSNFSLLVTPLSSAPEPTLGTLSIDVITDGTIV